MKKLINLILIFLILSCSVEPQNFQVFIPYHSLNIGKITTNMEAEGVFKIINLGNSSLKILSIQADCHCTTPSNTKNEFGPGDSTFVSINYDKSQKGYFQKTATVTLSNQQTIVFRLNGYIE